MNPMDAQSAFAEILENLPRQHLRTRFRNRFGTEESDFDVSTFARGTVRAELSKRLGHLMQEEPEKLSAALLTGTADSLKVAILAALNLADDYLQAGRRSHASAQESRLEHLVTMLDEALAS